MEDRVGLSVHRFGSGYVCELVDVVNNFYCFARSCCRLQICILILFGLIIC